ncbi:hypothetical protein J0A68_10935 [Algoriphagus sp. H41]|uniref:Uncharacterized protein n=1 Tax=Algoriphagus oliviformis TaxID=2811231 RepID=A0ABS3C3C2_9BACT|nr:hypothetical protein [Algoriphagus oliviformis]MBN7811473.1 hypothetical protein [Algoriphagus oliviformis]
MRTIFCSLLIFVCFGAFAQYSVPLTNGQTLTFINAESDNFEHELSGDTVIIQQLFFDGLDGLEIKFSERPMNIRLSYEIDFFQYTIDDNPAGPLEPTYWTKPSLFYGSILPDNYGNHLNTKQTFKYLGFNSQSDFANYFLTNYPKIKELSLLTQTNFINGLLEDERFQECCPEYIQQGKEFLSKEPYDFKTLGDLALELGFRTTLLELTYETGKRYVKIKR